MTLVADRCIPSRAILDHKGPAVMNSNTNRQELDTIDFDCTDGEHIINTNKLEHGTAQHHLGKPEFDVLHNAHEQSHLQRAWSTIKGDNSAWSDIKCIYTQKNPVFMFICSQFKEAQPSALQEVQLGQSKIGSCPVDEDPRHQDEYNPSKHPPTANHK